MKAVSGKRLAKLAEGQGWVLARVNGSHHIFVKEGRFERVVIPIHSNNPLKIGLQRSLMKLSDRFRVLPGDPIVRRLQNVFFGG